MPCAGLLRLAPGPPAAARLGPYPRRLLVTNGSGTHTWQAQCCVQSLDLTCPVLRFMPCLVLVLLSTLSTAGVPTALRFMPGLLDAVKSAVGREAGQLLDKLAYVAYKVFVCAGGWCRHTAVDMGCSCCLFQHCTCLHSIPKLYGLDYKHKRQHCNSMLLPHRNLCCCRCSQACVCWRQPVRPQQRWMLQEAASSA